MKKTILKIILVCALPTIVLFIYLSYGFVPSRTSINQSFPGIPGELVVYSGGREIYFENRDLINKFSLLAGELEGHQTSPAAGAGLKKECILHFDYGYKKKGIWVTGDGNVMFAVDAAEIRNRSILGYAWWKLSNRGCADIYYVTGEDSGVAGVAFEIAQNLDMPPDRSTINSEGATIRERILLPAGYTRTQPLPDGFGEFLRDLPLKPAGTKVRYYDGRVKNRDVHEAVIDMDTGNRDLQQCADAAIRLRAEFLYEKGLNDRIHFNFTSGFRADYLKWAEGWRIAVDGNQARWVKLAGKSDDYRFFREYLDMVFAYAGTISLLGEMQPVPITDMRIGDVFLDRGHCIMVVDMSEDILSGKQLFLLAQSYMPAQEIHILKNPHDEGLSPWYRLDFGNTLATPEWTFKSTDLRRFAD